MPQASRTFGMTYLSTTNCSICLINRTFQAGDDFYAGRDGLISLDCDYGTCVTRERALAAAMRSTYSDEQIRRLRIHESSPANRGTASWFRANCEHYIGSGYFPDRPLGSVIDGLINQDLEAQTFSDSAFDVVVHLDVMEHLFDPFKALREIYRTLTDDGRCYFSVPTYWDRMESKQVAFRREGGLTEIVGEPEYHGNPQDPNGSLVTWRYGYDLPLLISREAGFDVEVRRFQSKRIAVTGLMNEIYILTK
jgi:SAM-dependent methyltransferase